MKLERGAEENKNRITLSMEQQTISNATNQQDIRIIISNTCCCYNKTKQKTVGTMHTMQPHNK